MTAHELIQQMTSRFGPCIKSASNPVPDMVIFTVGRENTVEVARHLFHDLNGRFVITAGTDFRDADGGYLVDHVFSL
ncbi:MAG: hypothetical protein ONB06_01650, partial [candidate division KSB1 bacterium]|nr:hypothetical protein [candidate division KSB1 bacterium]